MSSRDRTTLLAEALDAYSNENLDRAEALLASILEESPNSSEANILYGIICARRGDRKAGIEHLQRALRVNKSSYEAHVALSTLLFSEGEHEQAVAHGKAAIALHPGDPQALHHLSRDLIAHGRTEEAIDYLRQALKLAPSNAALMQDLAAALTETGQLSESLKLWRKLTRFHPHLIVGWLKLGGMYLALRNFLEAVTAGRAAVSLSPDAPDARILLGLSLLGADEAQEAELHLKEAISLSPGEMVANSAYGLALHEMGRFEEARPRFEMAIELCPTNGQSYYSILSTSKATEKDRPLLEKISAHIEHPAASPIDRSYMHYALGKANEDLSDFETSMRHYEAATALAAQTWFPNGPANKERYSAVIQATIETFTPDLLNSAGRQVSGSDKPLLVVGMMRSGTTLVEQIISSHPAVTGAGELTYWHDEAAKIFDVESRKIDESALQSVGASYLQLLDRLGPGSARVTDKLPHNYAMIGFILAAFPNARVIYVKRSPIDNCLSIFTTAFQRPPAFTMLKQDIMFAYREHERIMSHWKAILPAHQLLEVSYEDVIENREEVTRKMIDFAGLDWDNACLHHERNQRNVNTPSVWQVRQPIYKTSVERWRKFEPWLGEFSELLP